MSDEKEINAGTSLYFNGRIVSCPSGSTLSELMNLQSVDEHAVTTAVNGVFVPRGQRRVIRLATGDRVLTFKPIVGG